MIKNIFPVLSALILFGCATTNHEPIELQNKFDELEASYIFGKGKNTIQGSAFLRQAGGGVVTCAGGGVSLIPVTKYSTERIRYIYGSGSFRPIYASAVTFNPDPKGYESYRKTTMCDADGKFEFKNIPNGSYYLTSTILWKVRTYQGGFVMGKVNVSNGELVNVILTSN